MRTRMLRHTYIACLVKIHFPVISRHFLILISHHNLQGSIILTPEDGTDRLSRKVGQDLQIFA